MGDKDVQNTMFVEEKEKKPKITFVSFFGRKFIVLRMCLSSVGIDSHS